MWEETGGSPALAASGSDNYAGLVAGSTNKTIRTKAVKVQALSKKEANELCKSHEPLVLNLAAKYADRGIEFSDLVSAGRLGLAQALRKFDPTRGPTFGAYARHRIKGAMLDCFKPGGDALGFGRTKSIPNLEDHEVRDRISPSPPNPDLNSLTDRESRIVEARCSGQTLKEVGLGLDISPERVRQIETRARRKLREWEADQNAFSVSQGDVDAREFRKEYLIYRKLGLDHLKRRRHTPKASGVVGQWFRSKNYAGRTYSAEEVAALADSIELSAEDNTTWRSWNSHDIETFWWNEQDTRPRDGWGWYWKVKPSGSLWDAPVKRGDRSGWCPTNYCLIGYSRKPSRESYIPPPSRQIAHHRRNAPRLAALRGDEPLRRWRGPYGGPVIHQWGQP